MFPFDLSLSSCEWLQKLPHWYLLSWPGSPSFLFRKQSLTRTYKQVVNWGDAQGNRNKGARRGMWGAKTNIRISYRVKKITSVGSWGSIPRLRNIQIASLNFFTEMWPGEASTHWLPSPMVHFWGWWGSVGQGTRGVCYLSKKSAFLPKCLSKIYIWLFKPPA